MADELRHETDLGGSGHRGHLGAGWA